MPEEVSVARLLDSYLRPYLKTIELARNLAMERRFSTELVLLITARLDSLASVASGQSIGSREAFESLLGQYCPNPNNMTQVSLGDLYGSLCLGRFMASGWIESGRMQMWSREDTPFLKLIDDSGVPLDPAVVESMFMRAGLALLRRFRVRPGQPRSKPSLARQHAVEDLIAASGWKRWDSRLLGSAFRPLIRLNTLSAIIYRELRNGSVHGGKVRVIDERRFYTANEPYFVSVTNGYDTWLSIEMPAEFLLSLLTNIIAAFRNHRLALGTVPAGVYFDYFQPANGRVWQQHLELIDQPPDARTLHFRFP